MNISNQIGAAVSGGVKYKYNSFNTTKFRSMDFTANGR